MSKEYKPHHIKLVGRPVRGRVHLTLSFNYGYKLGGKYQTLRVATGYAVSPKEWDVAEQDFTKYMDKDTKRKIDSDVLDLQTRIHEAYSELLDETGHKPSPDQILVRKGKHTEQDTPIKLSDFIREIIADQTWMRTERTAQKYRTVADLLDVLEEVRDDKRIKDQMKGKGPVMLHTYGVDDWTDMATMITRAATPLTAWGRAKHGIAHIKWTDAKNPPYYAVNTLEKVQQNLKAALRRALVLDRVKTLPLDKLKKVSRQDATKVHLTTEEISRVVMARMSSPHLEMTRQAFVVQLMTGVPIGDLRTILSAPITSITGKSFDFGAIYHVRRKTCTPQLIPLFGPALDILSGPRPNIPADDQPYNRNLKALCRELGLDRTVHMVRPLALGGVHAKLVPLWNEVSSHSARHSAKTMMEEDLSINRDLVCDMMGHAYEDNKSADRGYRHRSPEQSAERLIKQAMVEADDVFPDFPLVVVRYREDGRMRA